MCILQSDPQPMFMLLTKLVCMALESMGCSARMLASAWICHDVPGGLMEPHEVFCQSLMHMMHVITMTMDMTMMAWAQKDSA